MAFYTIDKTIILCYITSLSKSSRRLLTEKNRKQDFGVVRPGILSVIQSQTIKRQGNGIKR